MKKKLLLIMPLALAMLSLLFVLWQATSIKADTSPTPTKRTNETKLSKNLNEEFMAHPEDEGWKRIETIEHASIPIGEGKTFNFGIGGAGKKSASANDDYGLVGSNINRLTTMSLVSGPNIYLKKGSTIVGAIDNYDYLPSIIMGRWSYDDGSKYFNDKLASVEAHKLFSLGGKPPAVTDIKYYKKILKNGMTAYMLRWYTITKYVDNPRNSYTLEKDIQLANTLIMTGQKSGAVRTSFYIQNLPYLKQENPNYNSKVEYTPNRTDAWVSSDVPNTKTLKNFGLIGDISPRIGKGYYKTPLYLLGDERGLYSEGPSDLGNVRVNYYLNNLEDSPDNWRGGAIRTATGLPLVNEYFYNTVWNLTGFSSRTDAGFENPLNAPGNGAAGTSVYNTAKGGNAGVFFKNQPVDLEPGDLDYYTITYGMSFESDYPAIYLDNDEFSFTKDDNNRVKVTGVLTNGSTKKTKIEYQIDNGPRIPYEGEFSYPDPYTGYLGSELDFALDLEGVSNENHTISIWGLSDEEPYKESEKVTANLEYIDGEPTLMVDKKNGPVGQDFVVKGRVGNVINNDLNNIRYYNPTEIFYKKETAPDSDYKLATIIDRNTPDNSGEFEFTIPASDIPDGLNAEYKYSIRASNRYDMLTNVENIRLAKVHNKSEFTISEESKAQFLDNTVDSYAITLQNFKAVDYPLAIQYKVVGEESWTRSDVSIEVNDQTKTFNIPKEKLPFGNNYKVDVRVVDKYGVESDPQQVEFNMPGKPVIESLEKEQDFSMGVDYTVTGTVSLTDAYFPFKFYYKIGTDVYKEATLKEAPKETNGKFSFVIPKEELPKGVKHSIEIKAQDRFGQGSNVVILTLEGIRKSNVIVKFINDSQPPKSIAEEIIFTQEIETTINLSEEKQVKDTLEKLKDKYTLMTSPASEQIEFTEANTTVEYKFKGKLFIESFPSRLNFKETTTLGKKFIEVKQPKYDVPLVIGDTRNSKTPWQLTATLEKPLTSEESPSEVLKRALWYKKSDSSKEMLAENEALPIEVGTVSEKGEYNISNNWDNKISGLEVNVYSNEIIEKGDYKATILWQVGATP